MSLWARSILTSHSKGKIHLADDDGSGTLVAHCRNSIYLSIETMHPSSNIFQSALKRGRICAACRKIHEAKTKYKLSNG